jgi:uncharacterized membrane protein
MKNKIFISAVIVVIAFSFFFNNAKKSSNNISISQIIKISSASAEPPENCPEDEKDVTKTITCMDGSKEECDLCEGGDTDCSPGMCCEI